MFNQWQIEKFRIITEEASKMFLRVANSPREYILRESDGKLKWEKTKLQFPVLLKLIILKLISV